jgi:hypothetical protein
MPWQIVNKLVRYPTGTRSFPLAVPALVDGPIKDAEPLVLFSASHLKPNFQGSHNHASKAIPYQDNDIRACGSDRWA